MINFFGSSLTDSQSKGGKNGSEGRTVDEGKSYEKGNEEGIGCLTHFHTRALTAGSATGGYSPTGGYGPTGSYGSCTDFR